MGLLQLLQLYACVAALLVLHLANPVESTILVHFHRTPPARSRYSYAVFRYSFQTSDGKNACQDKGCSIHCQVAPLHIYIYSSCTLVPLLSHLLEVTSLW